jgi:hypothetical protein
VILIGTRESVAQTFIKRYITSGEQVYEISIILFVFCITNDNARKLRSQKSNRARAGAKVCGQKLEFLDNDGSLSNGAHGT